ncbi:MAG: nitrilase-related carbon-nitrogen hydrolase [Promethearchaeota archaeon]
MRLGLAQMELKLGDVAFNLQKARELLDSAKKELVDVLVFPEMANSGYYFDTREDVKKSSEKIPTGPFSKELAKWSSDGGLVVAGINEYVEEGLYNSAVIMGEGKHLGTYRKHHLYGLEKKWFLNGPFELPVSRHAGLAFSIIICFEWNYPERIRSAATKGAKLILHPVNSSTYRWRDAMKDIAIENEVFTASANRVGKEGDHIFSGGSSIINPSGEILLKMDSESHHVGWVDIEDLGL